MSVAVTPAPFTSGQRLIDGQALDDSFAYPIVSTQDAITATPSGTQATSIILSATISRISTVVSANDGIRLPTSKAGSWITLINDGANAMQVFGHLTATINDIASSTGISQAAGATVTYFCPVVGKWYTAIPANGLYTGNFDGIVGANTPAAGTFTTISSSGAHTFTVASAGINLKRGSNGKCGTFVCNGVTPVSVSNTSIAITDTIIVSLNTVGGTVGAIPAIQTITPSSGFTIAGTASDTSTYNYTIISNLA